MRGCPHAHICLFLHPDDKLKKNADFIDQMMWAEIPIDYDSGEFEDFLDAYRHEDDDRTHRWQTDDSKFKVIHFILENIKTSNSKE